MASSSTRRLRWGALVSAVVVLLGVGIALLISGGGDGNSTNAAAFGPDAKADPNLVNSPTPRPLQFHYKDHPPSQHPAFGPVTRIGGTAQPDNLGGISRGTVTGPRAHYTAQSPRQAQRGGPGRVGLRLENVDNDGFLGPPNSPVPSDQSLVLSSSRPSIAFTSYRLQRSVTVDGPQQLRLHVTCAQGPMGNSPCGDIPLTLTVSDLATDGSASQLSTTSMTISAATAAAGPKSNADGSLPSVHHTFAKGHKLQLTLTLTNTSETVTLYTGALPGEDTGNSTSAMNRRQLGGPNPARYGVPVTDTLGAFTAF